MLGTVLSRKLLEEVLDISSFSEMRKLKYLGKMYNSYEVADLGLKS